MLVPAFAISIRILVIVLGVWRIAAILDAYRTVGTPAGCRRPAIRAVVALLVAPSAVIDHGRRLDEPAAHGSGGGAVRQAVRDG
jgi:hypothetical protein